MCGRYFIEDETRIGADQSGPSGERRDICPGTVAEALMIEAGAIKARPMRWGFKRAADGMIINARMESVGDKVLFKPLYERQRCALPMTGYYEWRRADHQKYAVRPKDADQRYLAGLYRTGESGLEYVVLTQPPNVAVSRIQNRMPVILSGERALGAWLRDGVFPEVPADSQIGIDAEGDEQLRLPF